MIDLLNLDGKAEVEKRFWSHVEKTDDCWNWTGAKSTGYGSFHGAGEHLAHRLAFLLLKGPIPEDKELDHLCRNRACVNPNHLEIVTHAENSKRGLCGMLTGLGQISKTKCPQGHPLSGANLYVYPAYSKSAGERACKTCRRETARRYYWRQKSSA